MKLGGIYLSVGAKTDDQLKRDLARAKTMTERTSVRMKHAISSINFHAVAASAAVFSAGMAAMTVKVVSLGREFESTMKTVQAWSGASGDELKSLENIARKMGATTEHTATQAAGALKFLAAAGFSAKKSIAALPGTLDLATAGQVDLASATDITTDTLTAFGLEVGELSRVNDAFITASSSSNTNVMMLGQSFKMVAPTAKLFGLTVEQTAGFLGTLANAGIKSEMAGSGLNMVLLKSQKAAKMLGMELDSSLIDVLKRMKKEQWDAVQIGKAFGARQVKTAAILMDNIGAYEKLTKKIEDNVGATGKLAAIIRDSLDNDLKILNSTIQDKILDTFEMYKDDMRSVIQLTTDWIKANDKLINQKISEAIDGLKGSVQNLVILYNTLPAGVVGPAGAGIIGMLLFGGKAGKIIFTLTLINEQLDLLGMGLDDLVKKNKTLANIIMHPVKSFFGGKESLMGEYHFEKVKARLNELAGLAQGFSLLIPDYASDFSGLPVIDKPPPPAKEYLTKRMAAMKRANEEMQRLFVPDYASDFSGMSLDQELEWAAKTIEIAKDVEDQRLEIVAQANQQFAELNMTRFDLERAEVKRMDEIYRKADVDKETRARITSKKLTDIAKAEQQAKLSIYQQNVGQIADTFQAIAQAGGKHSRKAFLAYKAAAIAEAIIAANLAAAKVMGQTGIFGIPLSALVYGQAMINVATIAAAQPPSYDQGGISNARGIYQTGDIREAHIPIPSGGKIPVKVEDRGKTDGGKTQIILSNPVFQDLETLKQTMEQIAEVVAERVAPDAVVNNYNDDGAVRNMVRGGI